MINFGEQTWEGAMRHAHAAIVASERLYEETSAPGGRSNIDIEKHLRQSEVEAAHAQAWVALARALATEGNRHGHPGAVTSLRQAAEELGEPPGQPAATRAWTSLA